MQRIMREPTGRVSARVIRGKGHLFYKRTRLWSFLESVAYFLKQR